MRVQSAPRPSPPPPSGPAAHSPGADLIDTLKRRSTLVNMIDPAAMTIGLALEPVTNLQAAAGIASDLFAGNTDAAQAGIKALVHKAVHPQGALQHVYTGGQVLGAVVDGTIGSLEVVEGLKTGNSSLAWMGVADFVGGTSSAVVAAGFPQLSLALNVIAAAGKTGLVISQPKQFSRIQVMKTCFEAGFAVGTSCLRAGVAVVPALCFQTVLGPFQLAYMNHEGFQKKVDQTVDWALSLLPKPSK